MCYCTIKAYYITSKRHEYATYLLQYFQWSKLHTSTQDIVYQSTVIPLEVCCSPTVMLIHSVLCIWCQTYMFELRIYGNILLCIASWKYVNPSQVSEDSSYVGVPLTINVTIECGKFTVIAFFNYCLSLIAYDLHIEQNCNSGNNSSGTVTSMFAFCRESKKSASQKNEII